MNMGGSSFTLVFLIVAVVVAVGLMAVLVRVFLGSSRSRFQDPAPAQGPDRSAPVNGSRACRNSACQAANLPAAQFCARCGHPV